MVLASFLIVGGVIGAQLGAALGQRLRGDYLRAILAVLVLGVGLALGAELAVRPHEPFQLEILNRL